MSFVSGLEEDGLVNGIEIGVVMVDVTDLVELVGVRILWIHDE